MTDVAHALAVAIDAASAGAEVASARFGGSPEARQKRDGSWVSEADLEAEAVIRAHLAAAFPEHNILGEEEGLRSASGGEPVDGAPMWVVDPIDGTHNYLSGIPIWATLVALREGGRSVVGVCSAPALGELYDAATGLGARLNRDAIHVDPLEDLSAATFVFGGADAFVAGPHRAAFQALARRCRRSRGFGDFWGHMLVARGSAHVMLEAQLNEWDVAALQPIVAEAGGRVTHLGGTEWAEKGSCLTTNGALHDEVVRLGAAALSGASG
ncbi:MAG: histidinol-phosphatase [Actinomycetota bacterium]|jgi:histidinol-phosphatase|nr:histidinol-phosphatase [Actinomycetota bacterium]